MTDYRTMGNITEGTDVYGSDGDKVGSIVAVQANYIVVEKGFFFPTDYYIPVSAVSGVEEGRVTLNVTKDAALNQGWDAAPADYGTEGTVTETTVTDTTYPAGGTAGGYATDTAVAGGVGGAVGGMVAGAGNAVGGTADRVGDAFGTTAGSTAGLAGAGTSKTGATRTDRTIDRNETISVPIHEEELTATKTARELGEVRVEKDVVSEERTLSVPVTEERVRVERRAVDRAVGADEKAFEDEVIEVPVYGEDVQLQKNVRVTEEVEIGKEAVQRDQQVSGTVRREEVRVVGDVVGTDTTRTSDVDVTGGTVEGQAPTGRRNRKGGNASS